MSISTGSRGSRNSMPSCSKPPASTPVVELAKRDPTHLLPKMVATNEKKNLVRKLPTQKQVADWVAQAKKLPRVITY